MTDDPLNQPVLTVPSLVSSTRVPNQQPTVPPDAYRLAIVGEAPGESEEAYGQPFCGASGNFLNNVLNSCGILRSSCFVGNVCQYRPPGNDIKEFGFNHSKVLEGWEILQSELRSFQPNCILALGNTPLHFLTGRDGISSWRGSILQSPFGKVVPTLHPAFVLRNYSKWPFLRFDTLRARKEAESSVLNLPHVDLELDLSSDEICNRLDNWPAGRLLSFDIEGGLDAFPCCSVAGETNRGFIIAWSRYTESEQGRIAVALSRALYSEAIPKVLQNSLYDRFVLAYGYRMLIRNVVEDTMDKSWAIYSELPKGLDTITSIWTRHPHYKSDLMIYSDAELKRQIKAGTYNAEVAQTNKHKGCILDSVVTLEANLAMDGALSLQERKHYNFNVALKNPLLYMELRGVRYDQEAATLQLGQVKAAMAECASRIELRVLPMQFTKKEFSSNIRGEGGSISDRRLPRVLYEQKGYEPQYKGRGKDRRITCDVEALLNLSRKKEHKGDTFLADILLHRKLESIKETLEWVPDPRDGRMKCSFNQFSKSEEGDTEGGGSTETGRLRCSKSIIPVPALDTTVGGNLQTVTKKLRRLYTADPDHWLFQCDLAGADGWTVAARCLSFGDATMWDDYMAGLKPAKILALMYTYGVEKVNACTREELKDWCDRESVPGGCCDSDGWLYFACKRIQHGTNYGMQEKTMSTQIMKDSYKITGRAVYVEPVTCAALQRLYLIRYSGIYSWHNWAKTQVAEGKNLISASGHERKFFGRRKSFNNKTRSYEADHETWKEFLADEPQENTAQANNLALFALWQDKENRFGSAPTELQRLVEAPLRVRLGNRYSTRNLERSLLIEPLHTVHDANIGQWPKVATDWAVPRMRGYYNNPLRIANIEVLIPFEGAYGPSWGELGVKYGGGVI